MPMTARRPPKKSPSNLVAAVMSAVRDLLGMEIAHKQRSRLPAIATQLLLGIAGLALVTFVCFELRFFEVQFGLARTAFAYVIVLALVSLVGSFSRVGRSIDHRLSLPGLFLRASIVHPRRCFFR